MTGASTRRGAGRLALLAGLSGAVLAAVVWVVLLLRGDPGAVPEAGGGAPTAEGPSASVGTPGAGTSPESPTVPRAPDAAADRVVVISVDGLNPDALTRGRPLPGFDRLRKEGVSTLNARTALESTETLPNHTSMVTGRRVDAARADGHGVYVNTDEDGLTVHDLAGESVASMFDVVDDAGGATALYASKAKFALLGRTWDDSIDAFVVEKDDGALVSAYLAEAPSGPPELTMIHLSLPDAVGHRDEFMSSEYLDAVVATDQEVTRLLDALQEDGSRNAVILSSDHGGRGDSHRDVRDVANYRVPLFVWGGGAAGGADLYRLNPQYAGPNEVQMSYASERAIRNGDVANLALDLLGLLAVPGSELNADQDLVVTR